MDIHVDDHELTRRRNAGDVQTLSMRRREAIRSLTDLGLDAEARNLTLSLEGDVSGFVLSTSMDQARKALHRLRAEANAAGHRGNVAPIRSAIDRLGALWAVVPG